MAKRAPRTRKSTSAEKGVFYLMIVLVGLVVATFLFIIGKSLVTVYGNSTGAT